MKKKPEEIIIYGINDHSDMILGLLAKKGIKPALLCDEFVKIKSYREYNVIPREELVNHREAQIIVSSVAFLHSITRYLKAIGHAKYSYVNSYFDEQDLRDAKTAALNERYRGKIRCFQYESFVEYLDVVVTEKCTLRCVACSNLISHYRNPCNYDFETIASSLDRLLGLVDYIGELKLLGGELFLNKDTPRIIINYRRNPKIGRILIYTNGTLIPDEETIEALKHDKLFVKITAYKKLSRHVDKLTQLFADENINYDVAYPSEWQDLGELKYRNYTKTQLQRVYKDCQCRDIPTLIKNKIYPCPYAAHGVNLGVIPERSGDSIDILGANYDQQELQRALAKLLYEQKYLTACGYCSGRSFSARGIEPAIQRPSKRRDERIKPDDL